MKKNKFKKAKKIIFLYWSHDLTCWWNLPFPHIVFFFLIGEQWNKLLFIEHYELPILPTIFSKAQYLAETLPASANCSVVINDVFFLKALKDSQNLDILLWINHQLIYTYMIR